MQKPFIVAYSQFSMNPEMLPPSNTERILSQYQNGQEQFGNKAYENEATVEIASNTPIHLVSIADVYFGSRYTDVARFQQDIEKIREIPGAFILLMGNMVSNPHAGKERKTDVIPQEDQVSFMRGLFEELSQEGKIIAAVRSPYDDERKVNNNINITDDKSDVDEPVEEADINRALFKDLGFPVLVNGGNLVINFPSGISYRLGLYSKPGPYKSYINRSHSAKREFELDQAGKVDAVITAYQRIGDVTQTYVGNSHERSVLNLVLAGTYRGDVSGAKPHLSDLKMRDQTSREGEPSAQSLSLNPDAKLMEVRLNLDELHRDSQVAMMWDDLKMTYESGFLLKGVESLEVNLANAIRGQEQIRVENEGRNA